MKKITLSTLIEQSVPPQEFLLIRYGRTETAKGPYFFDEGSARLLLERYLAKGVHCYFDYRHRSLEGDSAEDGIAAGWFDLELRQDGLWAVNIKWTPKAYEMISNKEYLYISPAIVTDDEFVVKLINVALTNSPATFEIEPLTKLEEDRMEKELSSNPAQDKSKISKKPGDKMKDKEHLMLAKKHLRTYAVHASKCMLESDEEMVKKMYSDHHKDVMKMAEEVKDHLKQMGYMDEAESEGTDEDGDESVMLSDSIKALTGKEKASEQIMVLTAHKNLLETVKVLSDEKIELEKKVKLLEEKQAESEKLALIEEAISGKEKKLYPKQKSWALSLSKEQLLAYLEATPVINVNTKYSQPEVAKEEVISLSESDMMAIAIMEKAGVKVDKAKYLQDKLLKVKK